MQSLEDEDFLAEFIAFDDDFVEEQLFLSKEDFDQYLDFFDQMKSDFEHLETITCSDHNEHLYWHSSLVLNRAVRMRRGWIQAIAQMNDDDKDNTPKGLFALATMNNVVLRYCLVALLLLWVLVFIAYLILNTDTYELI